MKNGQVFGIIILIILIIIIIYYYNEKDSTNKVISKKVSEDGEEKILTYRLPTSMDSDVFGPKYWRAIHSMAGEIPCSICRNEWESFTIFGHDYVNWKLKKPIFSETNFDKWLTKLCEIKKKEDEKL